MRVFYSDTFVLPLPPRHRFPITKYARLRAALEADALALRVDLELPAGARDDQLALVHDDDYIARVRTGALSRQEQRELGFPWSPALVERSRRSCGGTIAACRAALTARRERGRAGPGLHVAVNLAGGTHHAFRDHGRGYCVFNDGAVAARVMQEEGLARRVAILDCDVHQGDGTAQILADDPTVFTFSIHGARNFPFRKQRSDLDIALPDQTGDEAYLEALGRGLEESLRRAGAGDGSLDLAIYVAGADPYAGDTLGRLALSKDGLRRRDHAVLSACRRAGVAVAVTMAGGYAGDIADIVEIHRETVRVAAAFAAPDARAGG
ncbi:MAG: histone deacetylase [Myxococcales bacterium]|nr:histone deacetylase [Myxococcales bacterium]MCB9749853.1 histone deacetylase [Myxococcales bacterium]